jgi:hypothetical protein
LVLITHASAGKHGHLQLGLAKSAIIHKGCYASWGHALSKK